MAERPEDAWERLAAVCEAADIPLVVVDHTPAFRAWWEQYLDRTVAAHPVPDHIPADPEGPL